MPPLKTWRERAQCAALASLASAAAGVVIQYGTTERALAVKQGDVRIFKKFDTLASYLKNIGIDQFKTDTRQFDPTAIKATSKRLDAAERMKNAHAAAAYKGWLTKEVQEAIGDSQPSVPHARVAAEWKLERAALAKQARSTGN